MRVQAVISKYKFRPLFRACVGKPVARVISLSACRVSSVQAGSRGRCWVAGPQF